jgi:hypothetical protein
MAPSTPPITGSLLKGIKKGGAGASSNGSTTTKAAANGGAATAGLVPKQFEVCVVVVGSINRSIGRSIINQSSWCGARRGEAKDTLDTNNAFLPHRGALS